MSDEDEINYWIDDLTEKRFFFENSEFRMGFKQCIFQILSVQIEINLQVPPRRYRW